MEAIPESDKQQASQHLVTEPESEGPHGKPGDSFVNI